MSLLNKIQGYINFSTQTNFNKLDPANADQLITNVGKSEEKKSAPVSESDKKAVEDNYKVEFPARENVKSEPKAEDVEGRRKFTGDIIDEAKREYTSKIVDEANAKAAEDKKFQEMREQERVERSKKATAEREAKAGKLAAGVEALSNQVATKGREMKDEEYAHQKELAGKYSDLHEKLTGAPLDKSAFDKEDQLRAESIAADEKAGEELAKQFKAEKDADIEARRKFTGDLVDDANRTAAANRFLKANGGTKAKATVTKTPYDKNDKQNGTTKLANGKEIKTYVDKDGATYIITSAGKSIIRDADGKMPKGSRFKTVFNNWTATGSSNEGTAVAGKSSGPSGASANQAVASAETNALAKAQYEATQKAKRQPSEARQVR